MMNNAVSKGTRISIFKLYYRMEIYFRSLKMLSVSNEHFIFLFFFSWLNFKILKIWEMNLKSTPMRINFKKNKVN